MGTPLPPNEPAVTCPACWAPGKPWAPGPTPKVIQLQFANFTPGQYFEDAYDQILLTPHLLEQTALPCIFSIDDGVFDWSVTFLAAATIILIRRLDTVRFAFNANPLVPCVESAVNGIIAPANQIAYDGDVIINVNFGRA